MKKFLFSLLSIGVVAGVAVLATGAFFSDSETSTGNTFIAGALDLQIDNTSYIDQGNGLEQSSKTSWGLEDPMGLFFDFADLKPGDWGEDTVSMHVNDNEAWACVAIDITADDENVAVDPELDEGDVADDAFNVYDGELASQLYFAFWADDGDNVYEDGENILTQGLASEILNGVVWPLQDSSTKLFEDSGGLLPEKNYYIGKAWCFGELNMVPAGPKENIRDPLQSTNVTCNGEPLGNLAQTDLLKGDITFYAEQTRHNPNFSCSSVLGSHRLLLENKTASWEPIIDARHGILSWAGDGPTFDFSSSLYATGLTPNTQYSLVYAPDPWPQGLPGSLNTELGNGTSDALGNLTIKNNINLGYDIPHTNDTNTTGGKIWLVLSADHDGTKMISWHPTEYLFEYNLITYNDTDN